MRYQLVIERGQRLGNIFVTFHSDCNTESVSKLVTRSMVIILRENPAPVLLSKCALISPGREHFTLNILKDMINGKRLVRFEEPQDCEATFYVRPNSSCMVLETLGYHMELKWFDIHSKKQFNFAQMRQWIVKQEQLRIESAARLLDYGAQIDEVPKIMELSEEVWPHLNVPTCRDSGIELTVLPESTKKIIQKCLSGTIWRDIYASDETWAAAEALASSWIKNDVQSDILTQVGAVDEIKEPLATDTLISYLKEQSVEHGVSLEDQTLPPLESIKLQKTTRSSKMRMHELAMRELDIKEQDNKMSFIKSMFELGVSVDDVAKTLKLL